MIFALLAIASLAVLAWPWLVRQAETIMADVELPALGRRHLAAALLGVAAVFAWVSSPAVPDSPTPAPPPADAKLDLRGKFVGPTAAVDAAITAALMEEVAAELEYDAGLPEPLLRTGQAMDQLRQRARLLMCRGVSLGERHPLARDAIKGYLDQAAGVAGGPLSPAERSAWVAAYRDVARAAADACR
jgi:hypothetical protein